MGTLFDHPLDVIAVRRLLGETEKNVEGGRCERTDRRLGVRVHRQ